MERLWGRDSVDVDQSIRGCRNIQVVLQAQVSGAFDTSQVLVYRRTWRIPSKISMIGNAFENGKIGFVEFLLEMAGQHIAFRSKLQLAEAIQQVVIVVAVAVCRVLHGLLSY